jgi:hypothetical protein
MKLPKNFACKGCKNMGQHLTVNSWAEYKKHLMSAHYDPDMEKSLFTLIRGHYDKETKKMKN